MRTQILVIIILLWSVSNSFGSESSHPDVLPFDLAGQTELAMKTGVSSFPALAHFDARSGKECLRYIAVEHVPGPKPTDTVPGHPTFQLIQETFKNYNPDFVIAEGFTNEPHFLEAVALSCDKDPGENMYTVQLAKTHNIPFVGGEPTDFAILAGIQQKGYKAEDMAAFYIAQQFPQLWRNKDPILGGEKDLEQAICHVIQRQVTHFAPNFSYEQWKTWNVQNSGRLLTFSELIDGELTEPNTNGTILQKLSQEILFIRDREIVARTIEANSNGFERILVVYGGSHYYTQHKALENHFGTPIYTTPIQKAPVNCFTCSLF